MSVSDLAVFGSQHELNAQNSQNRVSWAAFALLIALLAATAYYSNSWRVTALALTGAGIGYVLFQATFGFAGSFRAALERRDFTGFRAQAYALAVSSIIFFPLIAQGQIFGFPLRGNIDPIGVSFVVGAVMFGIGMQIGGGCASGTLFALGGGNLRLLLTLAFFVVGSALGAAHIGFWRALPGLPAASSQDFLGWPLALVVHLAIFGALIYFIPAPAAEARSPSATSSNGLLAALRRPWTLFWGALALALLNATTLVLAGRPWGETSGFALWGSKMAAAIGFDPAHWTYWKSHPDALTNSLFTDITSVMDFGIILGAALAAGLSMRFEWRGINQASSRAWIGAAAGGLLMGYGARLSNGCNIGAYFSALASGSLSAWLWVAAAFVGSFIGLRLRPLLKLP